MHVLNYARNLSSKQMHSPVFPARPQTVRLSELLAGLSHALDITEGQPKGHAVRCCWIGTELGRVLGLAPTMLTDLSYVLLLKDLGCSSNAARICALYLANDLVFKKDFKFIDGSLPHALHFVLTHTGLRAGLAERFRAILHIFQNGGEIARDLIETRCHRGADIARKLRFSEAVAEGIQNLDEHWDGGGKPAGLAGSAIPLFAQVALLAQIVDVFHTGAGIAAARVEIARRSGTWFAPDLATAFERVAAQPGFWDALARDDLIESMVASHQAWPEAIVDDDYLDDIAAAFAQVIDSKSPYTNGHSERVTLFADMIAAELGFTDKARRWLKRAALLHDIGKLGVSNTILDKPGKLDEEEWIVMRAHPAHSEDILSRISVFHDLAVIAGGHHERLDGKGYPKGLSGRDIALETRILTTADVFDALTAERPYRAAMPVARALAIMQADIGTAFDPLCFEALEQALGRMQAMAA